MDGLAGAIMQKPLAIQDCDGHTNGPTHAAMCSRLPVT